MLLDHLCGTLADAVNQLKVSVEPSVFLGHSFDLGGEVIIVTVADQFGFYGLLGAVAPIFYLYVIRVAYIIE